MAGFIDSDGRLKSLAGEPISVPSAPVERKNPETRLPGFGKRYLPRFKTLTMPSGKKKQMQLHATRGWKVV